MVTVRKRIHFKCPVCGHESNYALQVAESAKNTYVCEQCKSISVPKNYMIGNVIYGALLGALVGVLAYWIFTRYLFSASPGFAILAATPLVLIIGWLLAPIYSRLVYRWRPNESSSST